MASPLMIDIAIWYHCRVGDYGKGNGDNNFDAPAVRDLLRDFVLGGLLAKSPERSEQEYYATEALHVYVRALCNVPWPVQMWVIPTTETAG